MAASFQQDGLMLRLLFPGKKMKMPECQILKSTAVVQLSSALWFAVKCYIIPLYFLWAFAAVAFCIWIFLEPSFPQTTEYLKPSKDGYHPKLNIISVPFLDLRKFGMIIKRFLELCYTKE